MDAKALVTLFALCAVFAVAESMKCFKCNRLEWTILHGGDDDEKCEYPVDKDAPTEDGCMACAFDTRTDDFDWVGRHCIKDDNCKNGTYDQDTPGFKWIKDLPLVKDSPDFETERVCCETELCNGENFDTDAAGGLHITASLFATIFVSVFYNIRQ